MSVVEELRQNDPENTSICMRLPRRGIWDAALARALDQNPFVSWGTSTAFYSKREIIQSHAGCESRSEPSHSPGSLCSGCL